MKKISCVLVLILIISSFGCSPKLLEPTKLPPLAFDKTPAYSIDLSTIPKPEMLEPIFWDESYNVVTADKAKYVVLVPKEYAKVAGVVKLAALYKQLIMEQEILVNTHIETINSLKEFVALERLKAQAYRDLWVDSENSYRQEKYSHSVDNAVNRGGFAILTFGALVAAILIGL